MIVRGVGRRRTRRGSFRRALGTVAPLVALLALAGCGASTTVRVAEPSGTVSAHSGDTLVLTFGASPGIGYAWTLHAIVPAGSLSLVSDRFQADNPGAIGGSGSDIFTFKAHRTGSVKLTFRHYLRGRMLEQRDVVVKLG
jgi:predicted secreted protein